MFGSSPPFEYDRPFATFLLPSLLRPFRSRKAARAASSDDVVVADRHGPPDSRSSFSFSFTHRASVASASSSRSSTSSQSPPSLCSSSSPAQSFAHHYGPSYPSYSAYPSYAACLTAEPDHHASLVDHDDQDDALLADLALRRVLPDTLRCLRCSTDVALAAQIVSKGFTGRHGRAYLVSAPPSSPAHLFAPELSAAAAAALAGRADGSDALAASLVNIRVGPPEHRQLATGAHVVADISCAVCRTKLGWKYVDARDPSQRYKIGKFILETTRVARWRSWEDVAVEDHVAIADGPALADQLYDCDLSAAPTDGKDPLDDGFDVFGPSRAAAVVDPVGAARRLMSRLNGRPRPGTLVEFDSDDDDECEEIFAGTWDADTVAERRNKKLAVLNKK